MQICEDHITHFCYKKESILAYSLMNSYVNYGPCFFRANVSSLIPSNSGYHTLKLMKRNLDVYKLTVEEDFLVPPLKASVKKNITISYAKSYMYEENGIAKEYQKILATMKDSLLINNKLPVNFWMEAMNNVNYLYNQLPIRHSRPVFILKEA